MPDLMPNPEIEIERGLCGTCLNVDFIRSDRGSVFLRCRLAVADSRFAKYPRLPMLDCAGWTPILLARRAAAE